MRKYIFVVSIAVLLIASCKKSTDTITQSQSNTGIEGQLYANGGPGFYIDAAVKTIVVLESDSTTIVTEAKSDSTGYYKIDLKPDKYVLYVKESHDIYYSGPYEVVVGSYSESKAYLYDARIV
ncbi:MAG: hypothetical protein WB779_01495 [Ignavibacteriaceae bacterium]